MSAPARVLADPIWSRIRGQSHESTRSGSADAWRGVVLQCGDRWCRIFQPVTGDDFDCHLAYPPRVVVQGGHNDWQSLVVPVPQQAPSRPYSEPIWRAWRFTGHCPARRWSTQSDDEIGVGVVTRQECYAPIQHLLLPSAITLAQDALLGRETF